jgi:sugar/nucleoside kinase (ribokinase family)
MTGAEDAAAAAGALKIPVAIVGNLNLDVRTSPIPSSAVLTADGETSVTEIDESVGGGAANTAAAVALMGGVPHLCCAVGADELGARLCRFLEGLGVRVHPAVKSGATGRSIALTWESHHRHFVSSLPNTRLLEEADIDLVALSRAGCRHLYRADVWFGDRMLAEGNASLFRRARLAGMETSLDINWDPSWMPGGDAGRVRERISNLRASLRSVSFVHGNERELALFTGGTSIEHSARLLREWGAGSVIVHRGARGCAAATSAGWIDIPAVPVTRIVGEAGTGDVFTAAFLLSPHLPMEARLRECAAAAARPLQGTPRYTPALDSGAE